MKKVLVTTAAMLAVSLLATSSYSDTKKGEKIDGKREFGEHCAVCHPNGGNTINPAKPLSRKSLAANGIKNEKNIIAKLRNPGPGMTKFDENLISNAEAKAIAKYILKTFK